MKFTPRVTHISRHRKDGGGWGGVGWIVSFNIYIKEDGGTTCVWTDEAAAREEWLGSGVSL